MESCKSESTNLVSLLKTKLTLKNSRLIPNLTFFNVFFLQKAFSVSTALDFNGLSTFRINAGFYAQQL